MWPYIPKKCNCSEDPTNPNIPCKHSGLTTNDFAYQGDNLSCTQINKQDNLSVSIQKIEQFMCNGKAISNILTQIQNNLSSYPEFVDLVTGVFNCEQVTDCGPAPSTTTSTTTTI